MPSLSSLSSIICSSPPNARACSSCAAVCPSYNSQSLHCEERFLMAPLLCHSSPNQLTQEQCPSNAPIDLEEPGGPRPRIHRRRAAARPRVIGGSASPRSPGFFQKTSPVLKSFSKIYYARIVKSPLISALRSTTRRSRRPPWRAAHGARRPGLLYPEPLLSLRGILRCYD